MVFNGRKSRMISKLKSTLIETWMNKRKRNITIFMLGAYILFRCAITAVNEIIAVQNARALYLSTMSEQATWTSEWWLQIPNSQKAKAAYQMSKDTPNEGIMDLSQMKAFCKMSTQHPGCDDLTDAAMSELRRRMDNLGNHKSLAIQFRKRSTYLIQNVRAKQYDNNRTIVQLNIEEKYDGRASHGGANFKIMVLDQHISAMCSTIDHFNGTYSVYCSFPNYCSVVNVTLMFTNFSAFWGRELVPLNEPLYIKTICPTINRKALKENLKNLPSTYCRPQDLKIEDTQLAYWINYNGDGTIPARWQLAYQGCIVRHVLGDHVQKFVDRYQKLVIAGDSHMRYYFYYILYMVNKLPADAKTKLQRDFHSESLSFMWAPYEVDLVGCLKGFAKGAVLEEGSVKSENLLILSVGAWTLRKKTFTEYITQLRKLVLAIEQFKQTRVGRSTKIIWFASPPVRESERPAGSDHRNTYASTGANAWLSEELEKIGVEMFDLVPIIYPKTDTTVCGGHFLCLENGMSTPHHMGYYVVDKPYMSGLVGGAVIDYFVQAILKSL